MGKALLVERRLPLRKPGDERGADGGGIRGSPSRQTGGDVAAGSTQLNLPVAGCRLNHEQDRFGFTQQMIVVDIDDS